jgi:hypothetical protein
MAVKFVKGFYLHETNSKMFQSAFKESLKEDQTLFPLIIARIDEITEVLLSVVDKVKLRYEVLI